MDYWTVLLNPRRRYRETLSWVPWTLRKTTNYMYHCKCNDLLLRRKWRERLFYSPCQLIPGRKLLVWKTNRKKYGQGQWESSRCNYRKKKRKEINGKPLGTNGMVHIIYQKLIDLLYFSLSTRVTIVSGGNSWKEVKVDLLIYVRGKMTWNRETVGDDRGISTSVLPLSFLMSNLSTDHYWI